MNSTLFMNFGTWILAIASIPQMKSIIKNRHNLKGYSRVGSALLALGLMFIAGAFILMNDYISLIGNLIQVAMWIMATYYAKGDKNN